MAKQEREAKVQRINRAAAANQVVAAVNGKTTLTELAAKADELYVAHGGKTKLRSATYHCRRVLDTAEAMGVLRLTRPTDLFVERVKAGK